MDDIKPGDRVTFVVVLWNGQTTLGAGVVTRLGPQGHPMIQPNIPLPSGARMANVQKVEIPRG